MIVSRPRVCRPSGFTTVLFALAAVLPPHAAAAQSEEVDRYIKAEMERQHIPGLSLLVARDGKILKQVSYGMASIEFGVPATDSTLYQIASATKSFTAAAVMLLVQEGKFRTSDSVTRLLPGLPDHWGGVTVRHLLSHTSGLPDVLARPGFGPLLFTTRQAALDSLPRLALAAAPGEKWLYNQTNYLLLVDLVEKYGGESFQEFMRHRIFEPLGMRRTVFDSRAVVPGYTTHYEYEKGRLLRVINDVGIHPFLFGAAGIGTSAVELYWFAESLRTHSLLNAKSVEEMWTPPVRNDSATVISLGGFRFEYGYGFVVERQPGKRSVGHSGGGTAAFRIFPDDRMVVVVLHNGRTPNPDGLVFGVASKYNPKLAP